MAKLILEFLRVLLSWPPMIATVSIYLMWSQADAITRLIDRIKKVDFPGGGVDTEYPPELPKEKSGQTLLAGPAETKSLTTDPSKKLDILEDDFNKFVLYGFQSNRTVLENLVDVLWRKQGLGIFQKAPAAMMDKVRMINIIDPKARKDLQDIEDLRGRESVTRKEIIHAYIKSNLLVDYLRGLATRR